MYKVNRTLPSAYGTFREGLKDPLRSVPESVLSGWLEAGLITHCPLRDLPDLNPSPQKDKEGLSRTDSKPRTTYDKKNK